MANHMVEYSNEIELRQSVPVVEEHRNALYMPVNDHIVWEQDSTWGLYDCDGRLIDAAAYYRGKGTLIGQSFTQDLSLIRFESAPPGDYIYGGNMIAHFGHFMLSCISRFWLGLHLDLSKFKIVCHGAGNNKGWLSHPFIRDFMLAVGISEKNLYVMKRPTRFERIIVPRPACAEHFYAHKTYAKWGNAVGQSLLQQRNIFHEKRPVWISKANLMFGVQGLVNETAISDVLAQKGVDVISPETLELPDQVMLYASRSHIMGVVGSAFHSSILWPPRAKLMGLVLYDNISSNYALADLSNPNDITYIKVNVERVASEKLTDSFLIKNPEETVDQLLNFCG